MYEKVFQSQNVSRQVVPPLGNQDLYLNAAQLRERASGPIFFPASGTRSKCQKTGT
jgi:hypothetical protein